MTSKYINVVRVDVPPEKEKEAEDWFNKEHIPVVLDVPGFVGAKRYVLVEGDGPRYMTIWEIESLEALKNERYQNAGNTEWGKKIRPHFKNRTRSVYKQIYPKD